MRVRPTTEGGRQRRGVAMGWVNDARRELAAGREVQVRPVGGSMRGRIESGQLVTLAPVSGRRPGP